MSGKSTPDSGLDSSVSADIASHDQRAACGAKPVIDRRHCRRQATGKPDVLKDPFAQLDANGDGQVTKAEFEANAAGAATSSYNVMNEMIARQMQAFATSSSAWMKF